MASLAFTTSPVTALTESGTVPDWVNPANAAGAPNATTATVSLSSGQQGEGMLFTMGNASPALSGIPDNATFDGLVITARLRTTESTSSNWRWNVRLDQASGAGSVGTGNMSTTLADQTLGSSTNKWGQNGKNMAWFKAAWVRFWFNRISGSSTFVGHLDAITFTVYYTVTEKYVRPVDTEWHVLNTNPFDAALDATIWGTTKSANATTPVRVASGGNPGGALQFGFTASQDSGYGGAWATPGGNGGTPPKPGTAPADGTIYWCPSAGTFYTEVDLGMPSRTNGITQIRVTMRNVAGADCCVLVLYLWRDASNCRLFAQVYENGTGTQLGSTVTVAFATTFTKVRIHCDGTNFWLERWTGSAWSTIGSYSVENAIGTGYHPAVSECYISLGMETSGTAGAATGNFDNFYAHGWRATAWQPKTEGLYTCEALPSGDFTAYNVGQLAINTNQLTADVTSGSAAGVLWQNNDMIFTFEDNDVIVGGVKILTVVDGLYGQLRWVNDAGPGAILQMACVSGARRLQAVFLDEDGTYTTLGDIAWGTNNYAWLAIQRFNTGLAFMYSATSGSGPWTNIATMQLPPSMLDKFPIGTFYGRMQWLAGGATGRVFFDDFFIRCHKWNELIVGGQVFGGGEIEQAAATVKVSQTIVLKYDVKASASKTLELEYHIAGRVSKQIVLKYDVRATASKTLKIDYDVFIRAAQTATLRYDVFAIAQKTLALRYGILGRTSGSVVIRYDVLTGISKTLAIKYDVFLAAALALAFKYDVFSIAALVLRINYDVQITISKTLELDWQIIGVVTKTLTLAYTIIQTGKVNKLLRINYDVQARTSNTVRIPYRIVGRVQNTVVLRYDLKQAVSQTLVLRYGVQTRASSLRTMVWEIRNGVSLQLRVPYGILASVSAQRTLRYDVSVFIAKLLRINYDIEGRISTDIDVIYHIAGKVHIPITLAYGITNTVSGSLRIAYTVREHVTLALTLLYHVQTRSVAPVSLQYGISGRVSNDRSLVWYDYVLAIREITLLYGVFLSVPPSVLTLKWGVIGRIFQEVVFVWEIEGAQRFIGDETELYQTTLGRAVLYSAMPDEGILHTVQSPKRPSPPRIPTGRR